MALEKNTNKTVSQIFSLETHFRISVAVTVANFSTRSGSSYMKKKNVYKCKFRAL